MKIKTYREEGLVYECCHGVKFGLLVALGLGVSFILIEPAVPAIVYGLKAGAGIGAIRGLMFGLPAEFLTK